jgi:type IV pilus assembly protein PilX
MYLTQMFSAIAPLKKQTGLALVTAMIMLFVLSMLMLSTMRNNVLEERMASNARDWNVAFQAAEAALRDAERDITKVSRFSGMTGFVSGCNSDSSYKGLCLVSEDGTPIWKKLDTNTTPDAGWVSGSDSGTVTVKYGAFTNTAALDSVAAQPRYIIEALSVPQAGSIKKSQNSGGNFDYLYRVTAVGFGSKVSTRVMLQAVIRPN